MALVEQPLKKRKVHESIADFQQPLTQDEILRKQRNKADIRNLYEQYRRIKFCVAKNDVRLMPDFEQAYLALITASRGCTSAQRIVAELIPRYASHCPTALEAAAKVAINMYNWNFAAIVRGDDFDGIAFEIAQACIFGLVDICSAASSEASTSSVIQGICSTVFLNVLTFFISSFEGKDIYQIANEDTQKVQGSPELFLELKERILDGGESILSKLFKFRALSLLWIFFCCPKNLLKACFELFKSSATDTVSFGGGNYFMRQVTNEFPYFDGTSVHKTMGMSTSCIGSAEPNTGGFEMKDERVALDTNKASEDESLSYNCLLGLALKKGPSLRHWILLKYKKFCKTASPQAVSDVSSYLNRIFKSFAVLVEEVDSQDDSDVDNSDPSKYISRQYSIPNIHENLNESADKDRTPRRPNLHSVDAFNYGKDFGDKFSGQPRKPSELDVRSINENMNHESVKKLESGNHGEPFREHANTSNFLSPVNRKPFHLKSDEIEGGNHFTRAEKNQMESDFSSPAMRSNSIGTSDVLESPEQHSSSVRHRSSNQTVWYFDGDSASMDVFSASKQLWVGSLSPDVSETGVRFQVEKFGSIEQFLYFPIKGFALVEYTNIMDAIKARESMRRSSPWGGHLQVKFLDVGLGSRGSINGVAVGLSCYVYVGCVSSQWLKDDILHEVARVGARTHSVSDLTSENALLLEFDTADEATVVMAHLRKSRKENGYNLPLNRSFSSKEGIADGGRYTPIGGGLRSMPNNTHGSPHTPTVYDSAAENLKMRMSQLSSLMLSLSSKYNIPRNYHANVTRDEDRVPTNTLWIGLPHISSTFITDDEVKTVISHAVGSVGSVVRLTRENMQMSSCWFVELSSVDAAVIALKNLLSCPGMFFQVEFSQPGNNHGTPFGNRSESSTRELISPKPDLEKHGNAGNTFQMNWNRAQMPEASTGNYSKIDGPPTNVAVNFSQASHSGSGQMWTYPPPPPNQASSFMRPPVYSGWDGHTQNHPLPPMHIAPHMIMPNLPTPFIPPSVTPLPHLSGPPLPTISPPPLPISQPPLVPPPPTSPPLEQSQWQGMLSKSGVNYCSIYARREETDACKYSNAPNEPRGWPVRLDVTKRTDFKHVKSTFASTPPHRREVCRLLPSSSGDHKGFQDFITYLKQRECAGVIKIPGEKLIWPRLLFILPQLPDICSMVGVNPNPLECLIALVVPKEPTSEWAA